MTGFQVSGLQKELNFIDFQILEAIGQTFQNRLPYLKTIVYLFESKRFKQNGSPKTQLQISLSLLLFERKHPPGRLLAGQLSQPYLFSCQGTTQSQRSQNPACCS